ncbi:hypothetical protein L6R49_19050 [Myxococcota bacterium]|nr:hypothetical protein [Myxococcota bacterium]
MRALLLLLIVPLGACGGPSCDEQQKVAAKAWGEALDYYTRMTDASARELAGVEQSLAQAMSERDAAEARAAAMRRQASRGGLKDLRTGEVRQTPEAAARRKAKAAGAGARSGAASDEEESLIGALDLVMAENAAWVERRNLAQAAFDAALTEGAWSAAQATSPALSDSELAVRALEASAAAHEACD